jgi:hypothetical protein
MSESDQFRQYAEEAMLWVSQSKTEEEKRPPLELVLTGPKRRCGASGLLVRQCTNRARSYRRQVCGDA